MVIPHLLRHLVNSHLAAIYPLLSNISILMGGRGIDLLTPTHQAVSSLVHMRKNLSTGMRIPTTTNRSPKGPQARRQPTTTRGPMPKNSDRLEVDRRCHRQLPVRERPSRVNTVASARSAAAVITMRANVKTARALTKSASFSRSLQPTAPHSSPSLQFPAVFYLEPPFLEHTDSRWRLSRVFSILRREETPDNSSHRRRRMASILRLNIHSSRHHLMGATTPSSNHRRRIINSTRTHARTRISLSIRPRHITARPLALALDPDQDQADSLPLRRLPTNQRSFKDNLDSKVNNSKVDNRELRS
ncbi:Fungal Zn(2)-Cys(6) binuclear cluster domain [Emericellopsis cladophorae]|uniref:Fungal Zn(2)-Cys(6) binuclear cluster domain n=1 Tax=Emericellopsis cladophorae TaxID=2686198 RepID=A0A9P9XUD1_9HYPO|nr:Fungal Zn(2)-Cys(6) binuclear cluster domain [Emericellopsis cladophorae]KAI6777738.1 Fungal Zn(2)-Cys(6) binuclear cluster domain [Emericellopsis cladophorae]